MLKIYNSLSHKVEDFQPLHPPKVTLYTCGPTVYDYTHIGHLRKYVGDDILKRVLRLNKFELHHVMNITDVGHLSSDADEGDDKLDKGARERNESVWDVAKFFEKHFFDSVKQVNIEYPDIVCRATEHISKQLKLIEILEDKGFIYQTGEALYFDTSKFADYGKLAGQSLEQKQEAVREEVISDPQKKHPQDFAVWFFTVGRFASHTMHWPSKWGDGFPGWHIECSAMSMEYLAETIDIHTGGMEHKMVHHPNEIAQSEAATGKLFVKYWVHYGWLMVEGDKMSKSKKNFLKIEDIIAKGFDPIALRYLFLTAHYNDQLNFTWKSLEAAQTALNNLRQTVRDWDQPGQVLTEYHQRFTDSLNNDLNTAQALALIWEMVKSNQPSADKAATLLEFDKVLGLNLSDYVSKPIKLPEEVQKLLKDREQARQSGDFKRSDQLRHEIKKLGFEVEDTPVGQHVK